jgi:hypothetical protein
MSLSARSHAESQFQNHCLSYIRYTHSLVAKRVLPTFHAQVVLLQSKNCKRQEKQNSISDVSWAFTEKQDEPELKVPKKQSEWSDEEEEEEEVTGDEKIAELRKEKEEILKQKAELEKKLADIEEKLPFEQPKESSKKGKLVCPPPAAMLVCG